MKAMCLEQPSWKEWMRFWLVVKSQVFSTGKNTPSWLLHAKKKLVKTISSWIMRRKYTGSLPKMSKETCMWSSQWTHPTLTFQTGQLVLQLCSIVVLLIGLEIGLMMACCRLPLSSLSSSMCQATASQNKLMLKITQSKTAPSEQGLIQRLNCSAIALLKFTLQSEILISSWANQLRSLTTSRQETS